jgi:hypothetical protein
MIKSVRDIQPGDVIVRWPVTWTGATPASQSFGLLISSRDPSDMYENDTWVEGPFLVLERKPAAEKDAFIFKMLAFESHNVGYVYVSMAWEFEVR